MEGDTIRWEPGTGTWTVAKCKCKGVAGNNDTEVYTDTVRVIVARLWDEMAGIL